MPCVVYKYPVEPVFSLSLPVMSKVLSVHIQGGKPQMWVLVDKDQTHAETRSFICVPTGHEFEVVSGTCVVLVGTFLLEEGRLVFHLFEVKET